MRNNFSFPERILKWAHIHKDERHSPVRYAQCQILEPRWSQKRFAWVLGVDEIASLKYRRAPLQNAYREAVESGFPVTPHGPGALLLTMFAHQARTPDAGVFSKTHLFPKDWDHWQEHTPDICDVCGEHAERGDYLDERLKRRYGVGETDRVEITYLCSHCENAFRDLEEACPEPAPFDGVVNSVCMCSGCETARAARNRLCEVSEGGPSQLYPHPGKQIGVAERRVVATDALEREYFASDLVSIE